VGSLPSGQAVVDTAGEAVGLQLGYQLLAHLGDQPPNRCQLLVGEIEHACDVPPGDDQHVSFGAWKSVRERHCDIGLQGNSGLLEVAKWAGM
jgi:hypothetical protein